MGHDQGIVPNMKNEGDRRRHSSSKAKRYLPLTKDGNKDHSRSVKKFMSLVRSNAKCAVAIWGELPKATLLGLKELVSRHALSIPAGDLQLLNGRWRGGMVRGSIVQPGCTKRGNYPKKNSNERSRSI
jgi:hypothetical protein